MTGKTALHTYGYEVRTAMNENFEMLVCIDKAALHTNGCPL
jgi:hypothetical protein